MPVRLALLVGLTLLLVLAGTGYVFSRQVAPGAEPPIVIGQLQALSGPTAATEAPLAAAVRLAVDEINASGGLLGRRVVLKVEDAAAGPAAAAERLIATDGALALFGCGTTACRDAVRPVVERRRHLLFFPMAHEGMEQSPHIVYTGATPNQLALPATDWALQHLGSTVYLVGTDGPYPRRLHPMLRDFIGLRGGRVLGERFVAAGRDEVAEVAAVLADLRRLQPELVISTLAGSPQQAFFDAMASAGLAEQPLLSLGAAEPEMRAFGGGRLLRHFTAWSYLQSLPGRDNAAFLARLRQSQVAVQASDPAVASYVAVQLWAASVREMGSARTDVVNANVLQQRVAAPYGSAGMDAKTRHLWRPLRVAQVGPDGQLNEVFSLPRDIKPAPWPSFRSVEHWLAVRQRAGEGP